MEVLFLSIALYLLGSIPSGVLLARFFQLKDPRSIGSGNIGASNMTRLGGKKLGAYTLLADFGKAFIPLLLLRMEFSEEILALPGFFCVLGHCYSLFLRFTGGKGVATGFATLLAFSPFSLLALPVWSLVFYWKRITSLSALSACAALPLIFLLLQASPSIIYLSLGIGVLIFWRHRINIVDLWRGKERHF